MHSELFLVGVLFAFLLELFSPNSLPPVISSWKSTSDAFQLNLR